MHAGILLPLAAHYLHVLSMQPTRIAVASVDNGLHDT